MAPENGRIKKLHDAEDNIWYLLATIKHVPDSFVAHEEISDNRIIWNRCMSRVLSSEERKNLVLKGIISEEESVPIKDGEISELWQSRVRSKKDYVYNEHLFLVDGSISSINFSHLKFPFGLNLRGFIFPSYVDFSGSRFDFVSSFQDSLFLKRADFMGATFEDAAFFERSKFEETLFFRNAKFFHIAKFNRCVFRGGADFTQCNFSRLASFSRSEFSSHVFMTNAKFEQEASFYDSKFLNRCCLKNTEFGSTADFSGVQFLQPPEFQGAKMHPDTIWPDEGSCWPAQPNKNDAKEAERAWASLKWSMNQVQRHDAELDFFARELEAKRVNLMWPKTWVVDLYKAFSNYGRSALRPFFWWLVAYAAAFAINFFAFPRAEKGEASVDPLTIASFTLGNAFPLRRGTSVSEELAEMPRWIDFVSAGHTFLSLLFIFLIGLALRNRLRIK